MLNIGAPEFGLEGLITQLVGLGVLLVPVVEVEGRVGLLLPWVRQSGIREKGPEISGQSGLLGQTENVFNKSL